MRIARSLIPTEARIELNKDRLMILPRNVDKGSGLKGALSALGVKGKETACIGDGENDLSMFEVSGIRVALANPVEALKQRADFVTDQGDGRGTIEAIEKLFPARDSVRAGGNQSEDLHQHSDPTRPVQT